VCVRHTPRFFRGPTGWGTPTASLSRARPVGLLSAGRRAGAAAGGWRRHGQDRQGRLSSDQSTVSLFRSVNCFCVPIRHLLLDAGRALLRAGRAFCLADMRCPRASLCAGLHRRRGDGSRVRHLPLHAPGRRARGDAGASRSHRLRGSAPAPAPPRGCAGARMAGAWSRYGEASRDGWWRGAC
jgi:hypothetical protein